MASHIDIQDSNHELKTCTYCQSEFAITDDVVVCCTCGVPYHKSCWDEIGHCSVFGCTSSCSKPLKVHDIIHTNDTMDIVIVDVQTVDVDEEILDLIHILEDDNIFVPPAIDSVNNDGTSSQTFWQKARRTIQHCVDWFM